MNSEKSKTPRIILSRHREFLGEYTVADKKVLIGRSDFADIVIQDMFASKLHAMLLVYSDALVLLDLNSANGISVNSVRTTCALLQDDDIIMIGHHRMKVQDAPELSDAMRELLESRDTLKMRKIAGAKRLEDTQRKLIAIQNKKPR
jgi:pSer/pThr/pTyr-binding forkhead associated (FHA) protein